MLSGTALQSKIEAEEKIEPRKYYIRQMCPIRWGAVSSVITLKSDKSCAQCVCLGTALLLFLSLWATRFDRISFKKVALN